MIKKSTIKDISKETQLQSDAVANERTVPSEVVMTKVYKRTDAKGCLPIRIADGHNSVRTMAMCGMSPYFNNSPISAILHETKRSQKPARYAFDVVICEIFPKRVAHLSAR